MCKPIEKNLLNGLTWWHNLVTHPTIIGSSKTVPYKKTYTCQTHALVTISFLSPENINFYYRQQRSTGGSAVAYLSNCLFCCKC